MLIRVSFTVLILVSVFQNRQKFEDILIWFIHVNLQTNKQTNTLSTFHCLFKTKNMEYVAMGRCCSAD